MNELQESCLVKSTKTISELSIDPDKKEMRCGDDIIGLLVSSESSIPKGGNLLIVGEALYEELATCDLDLKSYLLRDGVVITVVSLFSSSESYSSSEILKIGGSSSIQVSQILMPFDAFQSPLSVAGLNNIYNRYGDRKFDEIWCNPCPSICNVCRACVFLQKFP